MMAWMNAESLRMHLRPTVGWSTGRAVGRELWRKGDTSGDRQFVREAYYDCDSDCPPVRRRTGGKRCLPHRRTFVLLPVIRRRRSRRRRSCLIDRTVVKIQPTRDDFKAFAAEHSIVPVWTEVLGDLETPVAAFAKLVGDDAGFLLESVEHGERWSRFSFVGRNPSATIVLRNGALEVSGDLPESIPTDQGMLAASRPCSTTYTSPVFDELPPMHGGIMGYLGYDVIREVEHLPDAPHDDHGLPDAIMSVIGSLAAFDHWRQRIYMIESVPTHGLTDSQLDDAYDAATARVHVAVDRLAQPLPYVPVEPPSPADELPEPTSSMPAACISVRSTWRRSTSSRATSSRSCSPSATTWSSAPTRSTCIGCSGRSIRARTCTSCGIRRSRSSGRHPNRWSSSWTAR